MPIFTIRPGTCSVSFIGVVVNYDPKTYASKGYKPMFMNPSACFSSHREGDVLYFVRPKRNEGVISHEDALIWLKLVAESGISPVELKPISTFEDFKEKVESFKELEPKFPIEEAWKEIETLKIIPYFLKRSDFLS